MLQKRISPISLHFFWLIISIVYAGIFITIEFYDNPAGSLKGYWILLMQWGIITLSSSGLMGLITYNKYVMALLFPPLILLSTILSYYRLTLGITLTPAIIELTFQNNISTALTVISWQLMIAVMLSIVSSVLLTIYRWRYVYTNKHSFSYMLLYLLLFALQFIPKLTPAVSARLPYSLYYCTSDYFKMKKVALEERCTYDNYDFSSPMDSLNIVVILGESLRPDHLQLNGYPRETTPLLKGQSNIISFPNVISKYCHTYISIPHILTEPIPGNPDGAYEQQSFITPLKKAGFYTAWISNQDEMESYSYFMHEADTLIRNNPGNNPYVFTKSIDGQMLPHIKDILQRDGNKCLIIHCIGSHWLYTSHYPDSMTTFRPTIKSRVISANTTEEIINSYDNTVRYADYFIKKIISICQNTNAILIYQSDHGEALGESGKYLHGFKSPEVEKAACLVWYSDKYYSNNSNFIDTLRPKSQGRMETTHMFYTILKSARLVSTHKAP
jgi:glucan phosphoethanolaminetransferase (alkaline phosphatase superfamily)